MSRSSPRRWPRGSVLPSPRTPGTSSPSTLPTIRRRSRSASSAPAGAPAKIADGSLHAYLGRDPYAGSPAPATVTRAESLAAYVVVALNPAARPPGRRGAPVRRRARRGRGAGRRPRLPALSVSGDALSSRLPPARGPRHGGERERPRRLERPAPARPSRRSRRHPARPSGAARHRRRLGCRGRDGGGGGAVGGGRRRAERQPRPAGPQDGLAPRLPGPPRRRGRSGDPAAGRRPPRAARRPARTRRSVSC